MWSICSLQFVLTLCILIHWQLDMSAMHIWSLGRLPIINTVCCRTLPAEQLCSPSSIMHQIFPVLWIHLVCRSTVQNCIGFTLPEQGLIVVSLLAHRTLYRRGNLRGACETDQSRSLTWSLLSLREEKCCSTGQLFIDCNNLDPAVYSLTPITNCEYSQVSQ